ncbi:MAG: hypothetical protein K6F04_04215 [bacterium]|nr:hypothetical protein [bacterium]
MLKTDIAFKTDLNKGFLPFITAFMVFVASITFATALIGNSLATDWNKHMNNNLTIQVLPDMKAKNPSQEIEARINNISKILKQTPGVKSYYAMTKDETVNLLKPWLGGKIDITLPRIISVQTSDVIPLNTKTLTNEIRSYSSLIKLETYENWMYDFKNTISAVQTLLGLIIVLILATTAITISYATKSGLNINRKVINIMHMVGATNKYISTQFSRQMMILAISGGFVGYIISCLVIFIIKTISEEISDGIIANFEFSSYVYLEMLLIPIIAGIIAKVSAMLTIRKELNDMM